MEDQSISYFDNNNLGISKINKSKGRKFTTSKQDVGILDVCKVDYNGRQLILVKKESAKKNKRNSTKEAAMLKFRVACIILLLGLFVVVFDKYSYNRKIDTREIVRELNNLVINQNEVLLQIENVLEPIPTRNGETYINNIRIMNFLGTTGVGKSFCTNIIQHGFKPKQVYHVDIKQTEEIDFSKNIPYLLILDDLTILDIDNLISFLHTLSEERLIFVINIFNVQETKDLITYKVNENYYYEIPQLFKEKTKLFVQNLIFNKFNKQIIQNNIVSLQKQLGIVLDNEHLINAINLHDFEIFGLKGFFAKLNVKSYLFK